MNLDRYRQTHTINFPVYLEEGWRRLKASYPHQSLSGLLVRLLVQYLLKAGFLFVQEIPAPPPAKPPKPRPRPMRLTGDARRPY